MKKALILQGDCVCHPSEEIAQILGRELEASELEVSVARTMDAVLDPQAMAETDLIVMQWHRASTTAQQVDAIASAVGGGTGFVGVHAFPFIADNVPPYYQIIGGHWIAHPGDDGVTYRVRIEDRQSSITEGIDDFTVSTEKYYLHVDPAIHVLASTEFGRVSMPVAWTKDYGKGRVFYHSLGHRPEVLQIPEVLRLTRQGMVWAAH
jgi:type 1 glutamine amidotransferase